MKLCRAAHLSKQEC